MIENLGSKLKNARLNNRLSRKQIAERIGVTASMIGLYETSERLPSIPVLIKLATQYKVSIDYLLGNNAKSTDTLSLDGLTDNQIKALKLTVDCFRNLNR